MIHIRLIRLFAAIISICLSAASHAAIPTLEEIDKIQSTAYGLLLNEKFEQINAMAEELRTSRARLADGRWKLIAVNEGFKKGLVSRDEPAWQDRLSLIDRWIAKTPGSATPYLAKADLLIAYAWDARGPGYANTVKEEEWIVFRKRLAEARKVLEASAGVSGNSPVWYNSMLTVATAQGWSERDFLQLFNEGTAKEPTYYSFYFGAATYLLPRWHGSAVELAKFVDSAVTATRKQEGETLYARIYWSLLWALEDKTFSPGYANWTRMRDGFERIAQDYPDNWNLNAFVYYACMAGDRRTAQRVSSRLTSVAMELWRTPEAYERCIGAH